MFDSIDDTAAALERLGPPISLFRAFASRPDRAGGIHGWGSYYLSRRCALSLRHREIVVRGRNNGKIPTSISSSPRISSPQFLSDKPQASHWSMIARSPG